MRMASAPDMSPLLFAPDDMPSTAPQTTPASEAATAPAAKTILVVDDDMDIRFFVQILMQTSGYNVLTAVDGIEALEQVTRQAPDLIILDVSMPHMDGLKVLRSIRANEPTAEVPIILLSAHTTPADIAAGMHAGANRYVTKPFESGHLLDIVQQLLAPST